MEILNLIQGSEEWLQARLKHLCASEAPAVMNESKFMTRNQLLDLKKGWQSNPHGKFKEKLFEDGHLHEEEAREITELKYQEYFKPEVMMTKIGDLNLLASFDGMSFETHDNRRISNIWEHKEWNLFLSENVLNGVLEPHYYWQLEHQALVCGLDQVLFTCSNGTSEKRADMIYHSEPTRRAELIAGWQQFIEDLAEHTLEAKKEATLPVKVSSIPLVEYQVNGTEITSNIEEVLVIVTELAEIEKSRVLDSDQDFANKDDFNKRVKKARDDLKKVQSEIESKFVSLAKNNALAAELDGVLQKLQSHGEKQVKTEKQAKKDRLIAEAETKIAKAFEEAGDKVGNLNLNNIIMGGMPDFNVAMKNKRNFDSIQNAVDGEVANTISIINQAMAVIEPNYQYFIEETKEHDFLFTDIQSIISMPVEGFKAIVKARISEFKEEQDKKIAEEAERLAEEKKKESLPVQKEPQTIALQFNQEFSGFTAQKTLEGELEDQETIEGIELYESPTGQVLRITFSNQEEKCLDMSWNISKTELIARLIAYIDLLQS